MLYSYDDHSLKTYSGYQLLTDPCELAGTAFAFIVITLDAAALRAEAARSWWTRSAAPSGARRPQ
ncbi:hypothetical protein AB0420_35300 [Streptomyces caelestis]|uniref:hypothetical protein n=1 Tax=Streptomyces TaxID=1883 RepID=UPI000AB08F60|nr:MULTISPECIES: hypothetical protein [Streptomyces]